MNSRIWILPTLTACLLLSGCGTTTILKASFQSPTSDPRREPEVGTVTFIPRAGASGDVEPAVQEVLRSEELGSPALRLSTPPDWTVSFDAIPVSGRTNESVTVAWRGRWDGPLPAGGTLFNLMADGFVVASIQVNSGGISLYHNGSEHRIGPFTAGRNHQAILTYRALDSSANLWFQEEHARAVTGSSIATWRHSPAPSRFQFVSGTVEGNRNGTTYWFDDVLMTHHYGYQGTPPAVGEPGAPGSPPPPTP
ncbi:MAG: hypothetical protein JNL10_13180 [Verrucomicrobiales bacterium]|nr:hypothetical protein [Verrucomicrobiales bacterium]